MTRGSLGEPPGPELCRAASAGRASAAVRIVEPLVSCQGGSFDALAIAPYFAPADEVREAYTAATTVDTVLADSRAAIATSIDWTRRHAALAAQWSARLGRPIGLVAYEGGAHLDGRGGPAQQAFYEASNDPRMGELYAEYLAGLEAAGLELYVDFQFTGQAGAAPWGSGSPPAAAAAATAA